MTQRYRPGVSGPKQWAHACLDRAAEGRPVRRQWIDLALRLTGDICAPTADGRKLAASAEAGAEGKAE